MNVLYNFIKGGFIMYVLPTERQILPNNTTITLNGTEYKILDTKGRGASCVVYLAENCTNKRIVLIKELYPINLGIFRDKENNLIVPNSFCEHFKFYKHKLCEAYKLQLEFHNSDETGNYTSDAETMVEAYSTLYVIMNKVVGSSYDKVVPENITDVLEVCKSVATVIGFYHKKGYLHLDIKPDNIYVLKETNQIINLFDFDTVKLKSDLENGNYIASTNKISAPEISKAEIDEFTGKYLQEVDERADIYAIGHILFEKVMERNAKSSDIILGKKFNLGKTKLLKNSSPQLREKIQEIFQHTVVRMKSERYSNTDELIKALNQALEIATEEEEGYLIDDNITVTTSSSYYISRKDKLTEIRQHLENYHIVYLYGIGGIGKSETAREYAEEYRDSYTTIQLSIYSGDLKALIAGLKFSSDDKIGDYFEKDINIRYETKLSLLSKAMINNERTLLIIDNYNVEPDSDEYNRNVEVMKDLKKLHIHILFTTRTLPNDDKTKIDIEELSKEELRHMFFAINPKDIGKEERIAQVDELIETAYRHTLTVDLVAHQTAKIEGYGKKTLSDYIKVLKESGINSGINVAVYNNKDDNEKSDIIFEHIRALFNLTALTEKEKYIMVNACLLPLLGMPVAEFESFIDLENYPNSESNDGWGEDSTISNLVKSGWIKRINGEVSKITLHPIIVSVVGQLLHPNLNKKSCGRFILELSKKIRNNENYYLIANNMILIMYQSNKKDIMYCMKRVWDITDITCFICSFDEIYFQRLVIAFIKLGKNMKEKGYYHSAHLYASQASYMCYKWKSLSNNFLLSKIYLLLGDCDNPWSHKEYKKCYEFIKLINQNKIFEDLNIRNNFYTSYVLLKLANQELNNRNKSNEFDKCLVSESYNHILDCRTILWNQILCAGYLNHNIIKIAKMLYAKSALVLEKYQIIKGDISCTKVLNENIELFDQNIETFFERIDVYTEILSEENITSSEFRSLVVYINKIIYSVTINSDFHISNNNMNKLIRYFKVVSGTIENESILNMCEKLILKIKDESALVKYDDKVLFELYWNMFYINYYNSKFYEAKRWGLLCLEQKYFKFYNLVQLEDTETCQRMYKETIPKAYYYLSVVEDNLGNEKERKKYYQKAVLYLILLLDSYSVDMHKSFYCIINENQIEKLFVLVNNIANKTIDDNVIVMNENEIIDDLECFNKDIDSAFISNSIEKIGNSSFAKCKKLKTIAFTDKLTHIGDIAFEDCVELINIILPNTLLSIGSGAFCGCSKLTNIFLPDSVICIGSHAFEKCKKLECISLSPKIREIKTALFEDCFSLTSIVIPEKCVKIGTMSFHNCHNLRKIDLSKVVIIESFAFMGCNNLKQIFIPQSVKIIEELAFCGCNAELQCIKNSYADTRLSDLGISHTTLYFDETSDFIVKDSILLNYVGNNEIVIIPEFIVEIAPYAFCNNKTVREVVFNSNIKKIGEFAFYSSSLEKIKLPDDILVIGESAFEKTLYLKNIIIPASIKKLSIKTFAESGVKHVILNEGLEEIDEGCFYNCKNLNKINLPKSLYSINARAFANDKELSIKIPKNVIFIERSAFKNCQIECEEDSYAKVYFDYLQSLIF